MGTFIFIGKNESSLRSIGRTNYDGLQNVRPPIIDPLYCVTD